MAKQTTPSYISGLLKPMPERATDRRVWSVPLQGVWLPFFTATNVAGETALSAEVLGAPLRLQREKDGTPRFSKTGRPVIRVVKDLSDQVRLVRDNFIAGLLHYAETVRKNMPAEYKAQVEVARQAGEPIVQKDMTDLTNYMAAVAEAARIVAPETATPMATEPERELVAA